MAEVHKRLAAQIRAWALNNQMGAFVARPVTEEKK